MKVQVFSRHDIRRPAVLAGLVILVLGIASCGGSGDGPVKQAPPVTVGQPVQISVGGLDPGQLLKVQWRGQTIGVLRRTQETLDLLPDVDMSLRDPESLESEQPPFAQNEGRALRGEYLVVNMHCTHLGCIPQMIPQVGPQPFDDDWNGGFYCPCHKSKFDLSGRVYKGVPAPTNLRIPPYSFLDDQTVMIGVSPQGAV